VSYRSGTMPDMDDHNLHRWREQAREHGIPEPDIDQWLDLARPHLTLHKAQDDPAAADAPIVGYRGGHPSLPPDAEWSEGYDFVASIDCAALPSDLPGFPLPKDGHLLFFHTDDGLQSVNLGYDGRVLYVPAGTATVERTGPTNGLDEAPHRAAEPERFPLQCWPHWDPPNLECHGDFGSPDRFIELMPKGFPELLLHLEDPRPAYARDNEAMALGGYCRMESDACGGATYTDPEHKRWRLLASAYRDIRDGRDDVPFLVHWIIREDHLAEQVFNHVKTYSWCLWA
jgi:hypothetical protein